MTRAPLMTSPDQNMMATMHPCPITRIEAERKSSPMARLVRHTNQAPAFI